MGASLLEAANRWAAELPAHSDDIEKGRRLPSGIAAAFAEAGFFHMLVPEENGGFEVHPSVFAKVLQTVATGDGSAGWNVMIGSTTGLLAASLPEADAREIYGVAPGALTVGVTAPLGKAEIVEGGYRVSGRWPFGSGCQNADWICGGCFLYENGERVVNDKGQPESRLIMFKAGQITIEDSWYVSGLSGTGSHHYHVEDQFVSAGKAIVLGGRTRVKRPLYQFPLLGLLAIGVSCVSLGIGFKALAAFKDLAGVKKPTGSNRTLVERPMVQSEVARSIADLKSAEAYIHSAINEAWEIAQRGERLSSEIKANLRLAAANATHKSVAAVDRLYQAGGGSSIYETSELQRCFRDIHVTTQHIMVASPIYEVVGKVELGLDPKQLL